MATTQLPPAVAGSDLAALQRAIAQAEAVGGEDLGLDAADRHDAAAQGDLTGHGDVVADDPAGEQAGERGRHGDAC